MRTNQLSRGYFKLVMTALLLPGLAITAQAETDENRTGFAVPWKTPQDAPKFIVVSAGNNTSHFINVVTGEVVPGAPFDGRRLSTRAYLVEGAPGVFIRLPVQGLDPLKAMRLKSSGGLVSSKHPTASLGLVNLNASGSAIDMKPHFPADKGMSREALESLFDSCCFSDDFRRVVWIKDGDIWRGDIDWTTAEIVHPKQVTHIGQMTFSKGLRGQPMPMFWAGNDLFVEGNFNPKKPLVRINLLTGETSELDWLMYEGGSITSQVALDPLERVALHGVPGQLRMIDLCSGKVIKFNMRFDDSPTGATLEKMATGAVPNFSWLSESVVMTPKGLLDISSGTMTPFEPAAAPGGPDALPSGDQLLLTLLHQLNNQMSMRALLDDPPAIATWASNETQNMLGIVDLHRMAIIQTVAATPGSIKWAGPYQCVYPVTDKGLSGNGTFLFDRRTGKSTRLASYTDISDPIAVANGDIIVFQRGQDIYRVKSDGSGLNKLADNAHVQATFMPQTIALNEGDPWAIQPRQSLAVFTSGQAGDISPRDRIKEAVKNKSPEIQAFAMQAMDYVGTNDAFVKFFDLEKATLALIAAREKQGDKNIANLILETDYAGAIDPTKAAASFRKRAANLYRYNKIQPTDEQLDALAQRCATKLVEINDHEGKMWSSYKLDQMFLDELKPLNLSLHGIKEPKKQPAPKPVQQDKKPVQKDKPMQQSEPANKDGDAQQEADDSGNVVDETLNKADEAKKTVDSLKNLFGH